jgi:glycerophosphoryl diester phosphodiesterase
MEKPQPFLNEVGQVNDPQIAKKMADREEVLRETPEEVDFLRNLHPKWSDEKIIDFYVDTEGKHAQEDKEDAYEEQVAELIFSKFIKTLPEAQLKILKKHPEVLQEFIDKNK